MKIKANVLKMDSVNKNNRIYTSKAIKNLMAKPEFIEMNEANAIPIYDRTSEELVKGEGEIVGYGHININKKQMCFEGTVAKKDVIEQLTEQINSLYIVPTFSCECRYYDNPDPCKPGELCKPENLTMISMDLWQDSSFYKKPNIKIIEN